jgi:hypothetical protein
LAGKKNDLFNLVVEHVDKKVKCQHGQAVILHGEFRQGIDSGNAHRKALVLQAVHKGAATACKKTK